MKTILTYTTLNAQAPWPSLLTQQLDHWHTLETITVAEVILEHEHHAGGAFRVKVRLEVSGPSLRADASDSTLEGALLRATRDLEEQIQGRKAKPLEQGSITPKHSAASKRGTGRRASAVD